MRLAKYLVGALLVGFSRYGAAQQQVSRFEIVVQRSAKGWSAHCDTGCTWRELSVSCPSACRIMLDANGVSTHPTTPQAGAAFAFVLERTEDGWKAEAIAGTTWRTLAWNSLGCHYGFCRARIDERGVWGV